jgi:hypothetical protein
MIATSEVVNLRKNNRRYDTYRIEKGQLHRLGQVDGTTRLVGCRA